MFVNHLSDIVLVTFCVGTEQRLVCSIQKVTEGTMAKSVLGLKCGIVGIFVTVMLCCVFDAESRSILESLSV